MCKRTYKGLRHPRDETRGPRGSRDSKMGRIWAQGILNPLLVLKNILFSKESLLKRRVSFNHKRGLGLSILRQGFLFSVLNTRYGLLETYRTAYSKAI